MRASATLLRAIPYVLVSVALAAPISSKQAPPVPATPVEPIAEILKAFQSHPIVALGEGTHGNEQGHAFRLSLVRHPGFAGTVSDILVEFGDARYQDLIDRFMNGEDVPQSNLRHIWQDTTQANPLWDKPIYEEFFRAVRAVNVSVPQDRHIRVLLGDPPINWDDVRTAQDLSKAINERDQYAASLIQREVLAKKHRALVIYGDMHLTRRIGPDGPPTDSLVRLLENSPNSPTKVFSIWTNTLTELSEVQPSVRSWPIPSLTIVRETLLGDTPFDTFASEASGFAAAPGQGAAAPAKPPAVLQMQDQFDAILYVGPVAGLTMSKFPPALCADAAYVKMRARRMAVMPGPPGPQHPAEHFKQMCAATAPK
jgi:hypothetical protein